MAISNSSNAHAFSLSQQMQNHSRRCATFLYSSSISFRRSHALLCSVAKGGVPYKNALISEAVRLLGPPARFEASKLTVDFMGQEVDNYSRVVPRVYILSHCDFTANLSLAISNIINVDQLRGWYSKDDVVAEWKEMQGHMCLVIHCFVSGPSNLFVDLAAEFRYHIFSKELPLVLQAIQYGDSTLFREHPELMDAIIWVYFHSRSAKYNCIECWGPLKEAAQKGKQMGGLLDTNGKDTLQGQKLQSPKSFFQALFAFLL